jgi:hypothetical protein
MTEEDKKWLWPEETENIKDRLWVENEFGTGEEALSEITVIQNLIACRKMLAKHLKSIVTNIEIFEYEQGNSLSAMAVSMYQESINQLKNQRTEITALLPETCR